MRLEIPQNKYDNIKYRIEVLEKAKQDLQLQAILKEQCKRDIVFFVNTFCYTLDPRLERSIIPFILYPRQIKYLDWLGKMLIRSRDGEKISGVVDKPRDVGATFTTMVWCLHRFLFKDFSARVGSRKEDYVDKRGEIDTLFYKLDFQLERLPKWLLPENFDVNIHRASMLLKHSRNSNTISGESANPNFGRGGRKSVIIFDEHGFWEWAQSSWEAAGESTNFRLSISTPPKIGRDAHFYKLLVGKKGRTHKFSFNWTDVPQRDDNWLKEAKETKSEEEFAREVLKSFDSTTEGKVYAKDLALTNFTNIDYDCRLPLFISWDFGLDGTAMIWWQKDFEFNKLKIIDSYWNQNKDIEFFIPFVKSEIASGVHHYEQWELDKIALHRKWAETITHFGDPDVSKRSLKDGVSVKDYLSIKGIYVQSKSWGGRQWKDLRDIAKRAFRRLEINETRNEYLISALRNAQYPERKEGSQAITIPQKPIHNWTAHFRSSFEYFCDNEPQGFQSQEDARREEFEQENVDLLDKYNLF